MRVGAPTKLVSASTSIEAITTAQRGENARVITLVLTILGLVVSGPAYLLGAKPLVLGAVLGSTAVIGAAHVVVRKGAVALGILLTIVATLAEHVAIAVSNEELQPVPYLASVPVLIATATLSSRGMWVAFLMTILALGVEGSVNALDAADRGALLTGSSLALITFVVSLLHVRSTERAFALANTRDGERAGAAAAAMESEERFRLIADYTDDLFALIATDGTPIYMNPSHARLFGQPLDELMRLPLARLLPPNSLQELQRAFEELPHKGDARLEATLYDKDDQEHLFDVRMTRVMTKDGPLVAMTSRDITERRQYQQRLLASERVEALGRLAGSVAHDFNNLLMVIGGSAEMARLSIKDRPAVAEDIDTILDATRTASKLTRQLLTFSRKQVVSAAELDLAESLTKVRELLERLVGKKVSLVFDFEPDCPKVIIAIAHLEQLAMNLAINARDAMPEGGELRFRLRQRTLVDHEAGSLPAGDYVELSVTDQGVGIEPHVLPHIFDPLFTTKGDAGTGLGLATCQSIATQWHGSIAAESSSGQGATFRVLLPVATQVTKRASDRPSPMPPAIQRVLVVDDEPAPRETAARLLRMSGFDVVVAASLQQARDYIADPNLALDALLTDVVLSGELGTDLLEDCRRLRPQARIVVMSGYSPNPSATEKLLAVSAKFLQKPFDRKELLAALGASSRS